MSGRERAAIGGWQAWARAVAGLAPTPPTMARGAKVAQPTRDAWRAHLAGVAALRS